MKLVSYRYVVAPTISFSAREIRRLIELSAGHYDRRCKAAGVPGGFLYAMRSQWAILHEEDPMAVNLGKLDEATVDVVVTAYDLDTLQKIAEAENNYALNLGLPILGELGLAIARIFDQVREENKRINSDDAHAGRRRVEP